MSVVGEPSVVEYGINTGLRGSAHRETGQRAFRRRDHRLSREKSDVKRGARSLKDHNLLQRGKARPRKDSKVTVEEYLRRIEHHQGCYKRFLAELLIFSGIQDEPKKEWTCARSFVLH